MRVSFMSRDMVCRYKNYTIRSVAWKLDKRLDEVMRDVPVGEDCDGVTCAAGGDAAGQGGGVRAGA